MLRVTDKNDFEKFKKLWETAFLKNIEEDHLKWKYNNFDNAVVYENENIFMAFYGGIKLKGIMDGNITKIIQMTDSCSHPNYRYYNNKNNVFRTLVNYYYSLFDTENYLHYGFPGVRTEKLGKLILNYVDLKTQLSFYENEKYENSYKTYKTKTIDNVNDLNSFTIDLLKINEKYQKFAVLRDYDFIKWRFFNKPKNNYKFHICIDKDNKLLGYLCYEIRNEFVLVIDILYNKNFEVLKDLLTHLNNKHIKFYLSDLEISKQLKNLGFIQQKMNLGIKTVTTNRWYKNNDNLNISNEFYQTLADTDIF